jgi:hypothetical protein
MRGAMACMPGGYAFQVYFWLPVDHSYQRSWFLSRCIERAYTVHSTTTRVLDVSKESTSIMVE